MMKSGFTCPSMRKRLVIVLLTGLLLLIIALAVNTFRLKNGASLDHGNRRSFTLDTIAAMHLQQAVNIASVSYEDSADAGLPMLDSMVPALAAANFNYGLNTQTWR